jgi:hypothetical protein
LKAELQHQPRLYRRNRATALVRASVETFTGYEPAARKGDECCLGGSIIKIAFRKKGKGAQRAKSI